ncbi:MAG: Sensory transduction histidine kinase [Clostridiales bacterium 38_11]|nr:MAG: Sensory transduction histidine kinase [Clostridiales bacterium 38_11]HBH12436.1 ATP-binding protein [Clostridiales bacterium]
MKELSLHILDIAQNSIKAAATLIEIEINENTNSNVLSISIKDNGNGMEEEMLQKVTDPFFTTRIVRNVGLGIPLLKIAAERCNGFFVIKSSIRIGTEVKAVFEYNHIDRAPLGRMGDTMMVLLNNSEKFEIYYKHIYNGGEFVFDTVEIKNILDDVDITSPDVLLWIKDYIRENIDDLKKHMHLE